MHLRPYDCCSIGGSNRQRKETTIFGDPLLGVEMNNVNKGEKAHRLTTPIPVIMLLAKAFQNDTRPKQEARTLTESGHPLYVLAWDRECRFGHAENSDGVLIRSFHHVNLRRFSRFGLVLGAIMFQAILVLEAVRLISRLKQRPIVHSHDFNTLLPGCFLKKLGLSTRLVYDCHELSYAVYSEWFNPIIGGIVRIIEERCLRCPDSVITVSDPIRRYLQTFNRMTEVIYNCPSSTDIPRLSKREARSVLGLPRQDFIISYVGEIRFGCKLDLLVSVSSLAENEKVHFLVVGGGPLAPALVELAEDASNPRLTIRPHVPHERALMYVLASDLSWVVYQNSEAALSERLAVPWKFSESLASGVPVLVERGTVVARLVEQFGIGLVLEDDNPEGILKMIVSLAKDPSRHHEMSTRARDAAAALDLSWEVMSLRLSDIYRRLSAIRTGPHRA